MLNGVFVTVVLGGVLLAAFGGRMEPLLQALLESARSAVDLAIGLVGVMALFLGLMRVATDAGLVRSISSLLAPVLRRLFPGVPPEHPAIGAIVLNLASNVLGLGNAATPFGVKAMMELDRLNGSKGTATNAMVIFLAINASGFALVPTSVLALRASLGSKDAAGILAPTWLASACATLVAVTAAWALSRLPRYRATAPPPAADAADRALPSDDRGAAETPPEPLVRPRFGTAVGVAFAGALAVALVLHVVRASASRPPVDVAREVLSFWILPSLVAALVLFGWIRGVKVYASLVEGAKEGFSVALRILPYLVAVLVMAGAFRASGGMEVLVRAVGPWSGRAGLPAEVLPVALLRPLSGSGAYGLLAELLRTHGPDSYVGYLASTIQGSTETTFYVLAVYFGAVGVRRTRHALPACLLGDAAGILAATAVVAALHGGLR